jgi:hypothetical protein
LATKFQNRGASWESWAKGAQLALELHPRLAGIVVFS